MSSALTPAKTTTSGTSWKPDAGKEATSSTIECCQTDFRHAIDLKDTFRANKFLEKMESLVPREHLVRPAQLSKEEAQLV